MTELDKLSLEIVLAGEPITIDDNTTDNGGVNE